MKSFWLRLLRVRLGLEPPRPVEGEPYRRKPITHEEFEEHNRRVSEYVREYGVESLLATTDEGAG